MKKRILFVALLAINVAYSQKGTPTPAPFTQVIHLLFKNNVGDSVLQTGTTYVNSFNEPFTVRAFKYYVTSIQLQFANGDTCNTGISPHLVNEADSATKQINFSVPAGIITGIRFLLGVDSMANTTGVQTGDLDPAKGMYWVWNTGYIMAKLEGYSPVAKSPMHQFTYDIGGYKNGENAARIINLHLLGYTSSKTSLTIVVVANILHWFDGVQPVKIAVQPMCHEPGSLAMQIADNYQQMFSVNVK